MRLFFGLALSSFHCYLSAIKCHPPCDISEFYLVSDVSKPPILYTPTPDLIREHVAPPGPV